VPLAPIISTVRRSIRRNPALSGKKTVEESADSEDDDEENRTGST